MKKIVVIILLVIAPFLYLRADDNQAEISSKDGQNTWDFGQVKEGQIMKHSFNFKNNSQKTVKILDVNTSCGCTASNVKKRELLPGESTAIEVKFKSKGYSGDVKQFIYVHTDNFENPAVKFTIKAYVVK